LSTRVWICNSRCAPRFVHCICWCFTIRLLTTDSRPTPRSRTRSVPHCDSALRSWARTADCVPRRSAVPQPRMVKLFKCAERSRYSMMDVEDDHNHMGAAFGLRDRIGQPGTPAAE
jgi:hypothetical protein